MYRALFTVPAALALLVAGCGGYGTWPGGDTTMGGTVPSLTRGSVPILIGPTRPVRVPRDLELGPGPVSLERAVQFAIQHSAALRIVQLEADVAADQASGARAMFLPHLSANAGYYWRDSPPGFNVPGFGPLTAGEQQAPMAGLKLMWSLYDFGRSTGLYNQAKLGRRAGELAARRAEQTVVFKVREAYFNVMRARQGLGIVQETQEQANAHLQVASSFFKHELVDRNDVLRAELQIADIEQSRIKAENGVELAVSAFNLAMGVDPNRKTEVAESPRRPTCTVTMAGCLERAGANRPELALMDTLIEIERQGLRAAKAGHAPRIFAGGGYDWIDDDYRLEKGVWTGQVGIEIPLSTGGKTSADIRAAHKKIMAAEAKAEQARDGIALEVKAAYLTMVEAQKRIEVMEKAVAQATENLRLVNDKYKRNVVSSADVVDAEALLARARHGHKDAVYDYCIAVAGLECAAGGEGISWDAQGSASKEGESTNMNEGEE